MSSKRIVVSTLVGLLALGGIATVGAEKEETIALDQLPAEVRAAAVAKAAGGQIVEIEREEEDGGVTYDVEVLRDGKKTEYEFAATGELLETEDAADDEHEGDDDDEGEEGEVSVARDQLPAEVRAVFDAAAQGAESVEFTSEKEHGATVYEAEYTVAGVRQSIEVAGNGELLETERDLSPGALPAAVSRAIQDRYPNARIDEAAIVTKSFYEVELEVDGKKVEVKVSGAGGIGGHGHDDDDHEDDDDESDD